MLVEITTAGAVRTVTMNRPEKLNAMTDEMLEELLAAFSATPPAQERVTVLRGAGRSFCFDFQPNPAYMWRGRRRYRDL